MGPDDVGIARYLLLTASLDSTIVEVPLLVLRLFVHDRLCRPLALEPIAYPCKMVLDSKSFLSVAWPNHMNFLRLTVVPVGARINQLAIVFATLIYIHLFCLCKIWLISDGIQKYIPIGWTYCSYAVHQT